MSRLRDTVNRNLGKPVANASVAMMKGYLRSARRGGVSMMHTARPFSLYRKIFYRDQPRPWLLRQLEGKRLVDVGCGYTPYAPDSMFRACYDAGIEFYGVDPLIQPGVTFDFRDRALVRATGGVGRFDANAPGLERALNARAENLPFEDNSVDEVLCSYLLFVWIDDQSVLADVLAEFHRVLRPGGVARIYPLGEWRRLRVRDAELTRVLEGFTVSQDFVYGGFDWRVQPAMLTVLAKN